MIRIKDYIFNENDLIDITQMNNKLRLDLRNHSEYIYITATIEDIEWNYDKEVVRKALDNDIDLRTKIQELEEKNKTFEDYNKDLNKQLDKLEDRINKAREYIENNKQILIFADLRKGRTNQYTIECDADDLLDILKGEE